MDKELLFVGGTFWLTCTAYVIYYFKKNYRLDNGIICLAILLGPIIALIMRNPKDEELRDRVREYDIPDFRHIPPPPPKKQNKLKDFKFFQK